MQNKYFLILLISTLLIVPFVSAVNADYTMTFKKGDTSTLIQICDTCTYVNMSSIILPNKTIVNPNELMTKSGQTYTYTYTFDSNGLGKYSVCGDKDSAYKCEVIPFEVTGSGNILNTEYSIIYSVFLLILVFLFLLSLYGINVLPSSNERNEAGLFEVSNLKHLRKSLFLVSWGILTAIFYLASNIGLSYFPDAMFGTFMFSIYQVMMRLVLPIIVIVLIWIFVGMFKDNELKKMIERGGDDFGDI